MSFSEDEAQFWVAYHNCKMGEATIREDVGVAVNPHCSSPARFQSYPYIKIPYHELVDVIA